jgi:hypothetical protein
MANGLVCLTFDFDAVSPWINLGLTTPRVTSMRREPQAGICAKEMRRMPSRASSSGSSDPDSVRQSCSRGSMSGSMRRSSSSG